MTKKLAVGIALAGSLFAGSALAASDPVRCDAMLKEFDDQLAANQVTEGKVEAQQARTEAEQACMSGDVEAAEATLDRAVSELGIPARPGRDTGTTGTTGTGNTGTTESGTTGTESGTESGSSTTQ
jgi:hypothetical protein